MKKNWKVLAWKFTQLNSAMGDALSQLKTKDTPNSAALRTDKVEANLEEYASKKNQIMIRAQCIESTSVDIL
ncbi:unnamed protein product [Brassica oleracea var. botrytis]